MPLGLVGALAEEISSRTAGGRVRKVRSPAPHSLVLHVFAGGAKTNLHISAHKLYPRINLSDSLPAGMAAPSSACEMLRPLLLNRRITGAGRIESDRIIAMDFAARGDGTPWARLIVEFIPRAPNVIAEEGGRIVFMMNPVRESRGISIGKPYLPPDLPVSAEAAGGEPGAEAGESPSSIVERLLGTVEARHEHAVLSARLAKALVSRISKAKRKSGKLEADLENTSASESIRMKGEILKANLGRIERGMTSVRLADFFSAGQEEVEIELSPSLSPMQNMEKYFGKYKKLKRGREKIASLIEGISEQISRLEGLLSRAKEAESPEELLEIAASEGIALSHERREEAAAPPKIDMPKGIRHFTSAEGYDLFVGKGGTENEKLTFSFAKGSDLWLHVSGVPGPHVVIRVKEEGQVPQETLLDAASLAVFFSKAKGRVAEVVYAWRKNLQRPRKGKPGLVYVGDRKSLRIAPDMPRLNRLLGRQ